MRAQVLALIDEAVCAHAALPPVRWLRWRQTAGFPGCVFAPGPAPLPSSSLPAHGTRMAGLVAACPQPSDPVPHCGVRLARIDSYCLHPAAPVVIEAQLLAALLDIARRGEAQVINLSWSSSPDPAWKPHFDAALDAVRHAGQLLLASAGNVSLDLDQWPRWPVCSASASALAVTWADTGGQVLDAGFGRTRVHLAMLLRGDRLSTAPAGSEPAGPPCRRDPAQPGLSGSTAWCRRSSSMATALASRAALRRWQQPGWGNASGAAIAAELCRGLPDCAQVRCGLLEDAA